MFCNICFILELISKNLRLKFGLKKPYSAILNLRSLCNETILVHGRCVSFIRSEKPKSGGVCQKITRLLWQLELDFHI